MSEKAIEPLPPEVAEVYEKAAAAEKEKAEKAAAKQGELERARLASWEALLQEILTAALPKWCWGYARIEPTSFEAADWGEYRREQVISLHIPGCYVICVRVNPRLVESSGGMLGSGDWRVSGCWLAGWVTIWQVPLETALVLARKQYLCAVESPDDVELDA